MKALTITLLLLSLVSVGCNDGGSSSSSSVVPISESG